MTNTQTLSSTFLRRAAEDHLDLHFNGRTDLFGKGTDTRESLTSITKRRFETLGYTWTTDHEKLLFGFYRQYAFRRIHTEYGFTRKRTLVQKVLNKGTSQEKTVNVLGKLTVTPLKGKALIKHLEATVDWMDIAILIDFSTENIFDSPRPNHNTEQHLISNEVLNEGSESNDTGDPILQQAAAQILGWSTRSFERLVKQNRLTSLLAFMTNPDTWATTTKGKEISSAIETPSFSKKRHKRRRIQVDPDVLKKAKKMTKAYHLPLMASNLLAVESHFTRMKLDIFGFLRVSWGLVPPGMQKKHNPERMIAIANARIGVPFPENIKMNSIAFIISQLSSLHEHVLYSLYLGPSVSTEKLTNHLRRKMEQLSQRDLTNVRPITDMYLLTLSVLFRRETYEIYLRMKKKGLTACLLRLSPIFRQSSVSS